MAAKFDDILGASVLDSWTGTGHPAVAENVLSVDLKLSRVFDLVKLRPA